MKTRRMSKAERSSLDRISTLPQPILETILCLLPTRLAVRTSILSREWRYKWTTVPKLELYHCTLLEFCEQISDIANRKKNIGLRCKHSYDINQILLQRQGPIHELTLYLPNEHCSELDKIILHLSRNHPLKKLTLIGWDSHDEYWYELPKYIFSFHHLTHLDLRYVDLKHLPVSNGFGSLVSLFLRYIGISKKALLHLLSNCPSLKSLSLFVEDLHDDCIVNELFECLPAIEHLTTCPHVAEWRVLELVPQEPPASLIHLKYLCYGDVVCLDGRGLAFLLVLIKCSPNLEKIKIQVNVLLNMPLHGKSIQMFGWSI
ncbi:F-box/FBD/LRR-repeat protein At1g13570-like isoform X1 [Bidens hawaiensis]|uniref:F-box/FBD/LRR-repeat protein At1g13570-like isoform X1 n=1 Tax=Bidens hawaiensis TaxID=980011 RepID=UPI00404AC5E3